METETTTNKNIVWSDRSESIVKLAIALSKMQSELEPLKKDSSNPYFKSKYADLSSVWDVLREPLTRNGLAVIQEPGTYENKLVLYTTLIHISGEYIRSAFEIPVLKQDPQGYGSAITYARRYTLQAITGLAPEDDDGNAASTQPINGSYSKPAVVAASSLSKEGWTGKEIIKGGKNDGKAWEELSGDTIQWYLDNSKSPAIKSMALKEMQRRDELDQEQGY